MRHGFVKVAAATPDIRVADVEYNTEQICLQKAGNFITRRRQSTMEK